MTRNRRLTWVRPCRAARAVVLCVWVVLAGVGCQNDKPPKSAFNPIDPARIAANPEPANPAAAMPAHSFELDGMIGQVNGHAIYAGTVLGPMHEELAALGRSRTRRQFEQQAEQLIKERLRALLLDALIYGEAERALNQQEQVYLQYAVTSHREELLRRYGQGSLTLAEENIFAETGKTLDQNVEEYRQGLVVTRYRYQVLMPKINVSRRDIERYYRDHIDQFNPPVRRTLRIIRVETPQEAERVASALAAGEPFAEVAGESFVDATTGKPVNIFRPDEGGLMDNMIGDEPLRFDAVNEAILPLEEGQYAGPIELAADHWFVCVETIEHPPRISLMDAQSRIEQQLRFQQVLVLQQEYHQKLLEEGSYNPPQEMADALLRIAVNRYAAAR